MFSSIALSVAVFNARACFMYISPKKLKQSGSDDPKISVIMQGFQLRVHLDRFRVSEVCHSHNFFHSEHITACMFVQFPNKFRSGELMKKKKKRIKQKAAAVMLSITAL